MKIATPSIRCVHATPYPEHVVEEMGRICYQSQHKADPCPKCETLSEKCRHFCLACGGHGTTRESAEQFVRMVVKRGHESVIEHVSAGFRIVTDRGVTHELVRHRIASFSQESTRYCDYTGEWFGGDLTFIEPPDLSPTSRASWQHGIVEAEQAYKDLRATGVSPQIARSVLPNGLKSEIGMTCNAREWRHFLRLRLSPAAHPQMRRVAELVRFNLLLWFPAAFQEFAGSGG